MLQIEEIHCLSPQSQTLSRYIANNLFLFFFLNVPLTPCHRTVPDSTHMIVKLVAGEKIMKTESQLYLRTKLSHHWPTYIHTYIHTLYLTRMHKKGHFIYSFYIIHSCTDGSAVTLSYSGLSKFKLKRLGENTYLL